MAFLRARLPLPSTSSAPSARQHPHESNTRGDARRAICPVIGERLAATRIQNPLPGTYGASIWSVWSFDQAGHDGSPAAHSARPGRSPRRIQRCGRRQSRPQQRSITRSSMTNNVVAENGVVALSAHSLLHAAASNDVNQQSGRVRCRISSSWTIGHLPRPDVSSGRSVSTTRGARLAASIRRGLVQQQESAIRKISSRCDVDALLVRTQNSRMGQRPQRFGNVEAAQQRATFSRAYGPSHAVALSPPPPRSATTSCVVTPAPQRSKLSDIADGRAAHTEHAVRGSAVAGSIPRRAFRIPIGAISSVIARIIFQAEDLPALRVPTAPRTRHSAH